MDLLPGGKLFPTGPENFRDWHNLDPGSLAPVLAEQARQGSGLLTVITPDSLSAQQLLDSLEFYLGDTDLPRLLFPDWETLPYDLFSPHQDIVSDRVRALHRLPRLDQGILITPVNTLLQRLAPRAHIQGNTFLLRVGEAFDMEGTREQLAISGYQQRENVREHGEYAVRGAIMDIFPMGAEQPFRVELFDEDIESLRLFDPESQLSTDKVDTITLLPAAEYPLGQEAIRRFRSAFRERFDVDPRQCPLYQDVSEGIAAPGLEYYLPLFFNELATLFDYLPDDTALVQLAGLNQAREQFQAEVQERHESRGHDIRRPILDPGELFLREDEFNARLKERPRARLVDEAHHQAVSFGFAAAPDLAADPRQDPGFSKLRAFLEEYPDHRVLICAETAGRREALLESLQKHGIQPELLDGWADFRDHGPGVTLTVGALDQGFWHPDSRTLVIAESQLHGERIPQRRRRRQGRASATEEAFQSLGELTPGSPVVHADHGVGRYQGLVRMDVDKQPQEFLVLEFAGDDKLYVPVSSLHLISRYGGTEAENAPLNRLGSDKWRNARKKAAEKVHDVAAELLNTYARREAREGRHFPVPDEYERFAAAFPFEETADQQSAIEAVIADMQGRRPMDRLICGDVGFGKTEVALRAAFLAVQNETQVGVLVPTTLLAQQHYESFTDRFADWPVNVEVLSRFRSQTERKQVLERLAEGKVDVVIGTHQLLQNNVQFQDLGLMIVDEEHRFGVRHKERLKQMRAECEMLTLTATPIPRTLNMSLSGLRDISIITTPPERRLSVKTFVQQKDGTTLREAMLRELLRGGQVYYLHNDIESMDRAVEEVQELVPDARVGVAHGQMRERDLESVMSDFYHRRFNVLVCTTIIETGIDVPSANTIIIERADKFGLAQLHQLRGRVGRSHHQAYAYLLTPDRRSMTADALKRLDAIESASDLGAGFMLASHDMEIRGAGELLGEEQHGNMTNVGFSLYMEMLEEAVDALKRGETPDTETPLSGGPEINLNVPALIPEDYLPDVFTRLTLYKRIAGCTTADQLKELQVEIIDRFGLLPEPVKNLFRVTEMRQRAARMGINRIDAGESGGRMEFSERTGVDPGHIVRMVQDAPGRYSLDGATSFKFKLDADNASERIEEVEYLLEQLDQPEPAAHAGGES